VICRGGQGPTPGADQAAAEALEPATGWTSTSGGNTLSSCAARQATRRATSRLSPLAVWPHRPPCGSGALLQQETSLSWAGDGAGLYARQAHG
jgi:hypothetical protein